ncbi:glycoside hydrolase family 15 protein [Halopseudomonas sp. SMJS2]|uniref:glycoside hydrolase family 15 protein n=1 Tax=Halopseudomonas sp. SMJS2 TaxID=3041098 RepID=UPI0024532E28|nr:glycoside hydrolase family 15 protein [Halopseudomonas sp. SMJS2]WGK62159.1 glycoside hydrolase family 15 protein [Halopseudomonas sp. SMJS2]
MTQPIKDYALLGNLRCSALVGRNGSIDWFCPPRFDSPACFTRLLGNEEHGFWQLAPQLPVQKAQRHYQSDTLVLCTEFDCGDAGRVRITDFMPLNSEALIVRRVEGLEGSVQMDMQLAPRFGYGARAARCEEGAQGVSLWDTDGQRLLLTSQSPLRIGADNVSASFALGAGEMHEFTLFHLLPEQQPGVGADPQQLLDDCLQWWRDWVRQCSYHGRWREAVIRSLITLKALTHEPSGSMVAAPTTSLPEAPGHGANWDYRFCWIRDAVWALDILIDSNYLTEVHAWINWLQRVIERNDGDMRVLYSVDGQSANGEHEMDWLPGHLDSQPVRVGNGAYDQHQLDVYGQLVDLLHIARRSGAYLSQQDWQDQRRLLEKVIDCWQQPDEGIWELRDQRRHYVHSKVYAWVALDRSIRDAEEYGLEAPLEEWRAVRDEIHADICRKGINAQRGAFQQSYERACPDASLLMIPLLGFLPIDDPRVQATIAWIEQDLLRDGVVHRFPPQDSFSGDEGAFLACSFWFADTLVMSGRDGDAENMFAHLLALRNDVGLLAEQYDPRYGLIGNFPQALSHLALVKSAYLLQACEQVHHGGEPERHSYKPVI